MTGDMDQNLECAMVSNRAVLNLYSEILQQQVGSMMTQQRLLKLERAMERMEKEMEKGLEGILSQKTSPGSSSREDALRSQPLFPLLNADQRAELLSRVKVEADAAAGGTLTSSIECVPGHGAVGPVIASCPSGFEQDRSGSKETQTEGGSDKEIGVYVQV